MRDFLWLRVHGLVKIADGVRTILVGRLGPNLILEHARRKARRRGV